MNGWKLSAMFRQGGRRQAKRSGTAPRRGARPPGFARLPDLFRRGVGESGETMLEFAIIAPMLILLMLTIVDLGIMLTAQSLLDGAARDAARLIRTGQVASAGNSITTFENQLCSEMSPIMSASACQQQIVFEVQTFSDFGSVAFSACSQTSYQTGNGTVCAWTPGIAGNIVGVQVTYNRRFIVPWVGACLSGQACWMGMGTARTTTSGNAVPLVATVVFKNEPFPTS